MPPTPHSDDTASSIFLVFEKYSFKLRQKQISVDACLPNIFLILSVFFNKFYDFDINLLVLDQLGIESDRNQADKERAEPADA